MIGADLPRRLPPSRAKPPSLARHRGGLSPAHAKGRSAHTFRIIQFRSEPDPTAFSFQVDWLERVYGLFAVVAIEQIAVGQVAVFY